MRYGASWIAVVLSGFGAFVLAGCSVVVDQFEFVDGTDAGPFVDAGSDAGTRDGGFDGGVPCAETRVVEIAAGNDHTCLLRTCGLVYCWGEGNSGQLGDGMQRQSSSPVLVSGIDDAVEIQAGERFSCARHRSGGVSCWGANGWGELGDGSTMQRNTPVPVVGITDAVELSKGASIHTCAIHEGRGAISCWGSNESGQLGDTTTEVRRRPVAAMGIDGHSWEQVVTGTGHTCALASDGMVLCWGGGGFGALGNMSETNSPTPVAPMGLAAASHIAAGIHTCAGVGGMNVYCWGYNRFGQVGDGTEVNRLVPVAVATVTLEGLVAGREHTCTLSAAGNAACFGRNDRGQLGLGTTTNSSTLQALTSITGIRSLTAGVAHTCALLDDNSISCWGANEAGQLGDGTSTDQSEPVQALPAL